MLGVFIIFLIWNSANFTANPTPSDVEVARFLTRIALGVAVVIYICYKKGEKPRWQWGKYKE